MCCSASAHEFSFPGIRAGKEQVPTGSSSLVNKVEAEMLLCVFQQFMRKLPELMQRPATAIITPYKAQVRLSLPPSLILSVQTLPARQAPH